MKGKTSMYVHVYPNEADALEFKGVCSIVGSRLIYEPRREKTGLRDFRPGPTQTGLYKLRKELEA